MKWEAIRALVIDDSAFSGNLVKSLLHSIGIRTIRLCQSGTEGLDIFRANAEKLDIVITDWLMPDMSGLDVLKAIRAETSPRRDLPVVLITGEPKSERVLEGRQHGAQDFLVKPVSKARLETSLLKVLNARPRK